MAETYADYPELSAEALAIARRQKIAEMLMQQGQQPLETGRVAGGYVTPISPFEVLGKLANQYVGQKKMSEAEKEQKDLASKREAINQAELERIMKIQSGTPAIEQQTQPFVPDTFDETDQPFDKMNPIVTGAPQGAPAQAMEMYGAAPQPAINVEQPQITGKMDTITAPAQPAVAGNPREAVIQAQLSRNPMLQRYGLAQQKFMEADEAKAATIEQRQWEIKQKAEQGMKEIEEKARLGLISQREKQEAQANLQKTLLTMGAALKQPRQEPAPTMTEVVDPSDQKRMLRVDARTYKGGGLGSAGVLGVSGKEPSLAKKDEKEGQGKELLATELDNMRQHYTTLKELGGMPSSDSGTLSNAMAWTQSSGAGQLGGRIFGTKEQDERNAIKSTRLLLMNAIKNATGMSAQQMNSNVELKTWLDSLGDPTQSYESNMEIIKNIEESFIKGAGKKPNPVAPSSPSLPPGFVPDK